MRGTGDRIIGLREMLNISQIGLAKMVGLSATTLSKYEKNLREPRAEIIVKLADALDTTSDYLLCRTSDSAPVKKDSSWVKLNEEENLLLQTFRFLQEREKGQIIERAQILYEQHAKKQSGDISNSSRTIESNVRNNQPPQKQADLN